MEQRRGVAVRPFFFSEGRRLCVAMLILDFETRSHVDLTRYGSWVYATDPTTEVICCSFGYDDLLWTWRNPGLFQLNGPPRLPEWLSDYLIGTDWRVAAHNAPFDRAVWDYVFQPDWDMPDIAPERWYCTSALCRVNALPGKLDDAIRAVTSDMRKDHRGSALIRKLSVPPYETDRGLLDEMVEYCEQDLRVTQRLVDECRPLTDAEWHDWQVNERINGRGIRIDRRLAEQAVKYAGDEQAAIAARLSQVTNGRITKHTQTKRICEFVREQLEMADITTLPMVRYKGGRKRYSVDKAVRAELLGRVDELDIPRHVVEVLELTDDGNRSSVAKFQKMLNYSDPEDDRVRNAFVYAGAQSTLRFSSRGVQAHNMRRDCWSEEETTQIGFQMAADQPLDSVMDTLSKLLRPTLIPAKDHVFVVGDWSAIEAMGLPWLANTPEAEKVLDVFRRDEDVYLKTCKQIAITDRQIGKVATLSLGYGGAAGAFNSMARNYGVFLDDSLVKLIVNRWRRANPWAPEFWYALERAAKLAIRQPGQEFHAGRVSYIYISWLLGGTLLCCMPGDIVIQYPQARIESVEGRQGSSITALKAAWTAKADATEWPRHVLWHGLLAENATQAFCAGVLRHLLERADDDGWPVVADVHDEVVLEVPESQAYAARDWLAREMSTPAAWAAGLPLKAEPTIRYRYGK